jgi:hypothetical protein
MRWMLLIVAAVALAGCSPNHAHMRDAHADLPSGNRLPFLDSTPHWGKWSPDPEP